MSVGCQVCLAPVYILVFHLESPNRSGYDSIKIGFLRSRWADGPSFLLTPPLQSGDGRKTVSRGAGDSFISPSLPSCDCLHLSIYLRILCLSLYPTPPFPPYSPQSISNLLVKTVHAPSGCNQQPTQREQSIRINSWYNKVKIIYFPRSIYLKYWDISPDIGYWEPNLVPALTKPVYNTNQAALVTGKPYRPWIKGIFRDLSLLYLSLGIILTLRIYKSNIYLNLWNLFPE